MDLDPPRRADELVLATERLFEAAIDLGEDVAESVPDAARTFLTRWQVRFDDINSALLGMALSRTIGEVLGKE